MFDNPISSPMICPCIVLGRVLVLCRWAVEKPSSRLKAGRSGPLEMGPELKVDVCIGAVGIEYVCLNLFKPLSGKNLWCARRSSKRPRQKKESAPARARRPRTRAAHRAILYSFFFAGGLRLHHMYAKGPDADTSHSRLFKIAVHCT